MLYVQDVRYTLRQLARAPAYTILTVIVLAGGLALSIFTFAFLHTAILKPLPLLDGDRIVRLMRVEGGASIGLVDAADLSAIRRSITTLTEIRAFTNRDLVLAGDEGARSISATATEWNIFEMTRTPPLMGRGFTLEDQAPGAEPVIVLTYSTWSAAFGAEPSILGSLVQVNGVATRVVGVMPEAYEFPVATDAYVPIRPIAGIVLGATWLPTRRAIDRAAGRAPPRRRLISYARVTVIARVSASHTARSACKPCRS